MSASSQQRRFVLHRHRHGDGEHWDLMLEQDDALATWRLQELPGQDRRPVEAVRIFDHRKSFLSYQGPLRAGRGEVRIVDSGDYDLIEQTDQRWVVLLGGRRLGGCFMLESKQGQEWSISAAPCRRDGSEPERS